MPKKKKNTGTFTYTDNSGVTRTETLTRKECLLLKESIDSHRYWQLTDDRYKNSGFTMGPGADDPDVAQEIVEATALEEKLERLIGVIEPTPVKTRVRREIEAEMACGEDT